MQPYYDDGTVTIYHGDCQSVLFEDWMSDSIIESAGVLITDPPYGMAYVSRSKRSSWGAIEGDGSTDARNWLLQHWGRRPAAVFGTWKIARPHGVTAILIWDKSEGTGPGMGDLAAAFGSSHEEIYLLGEWPRRDGVPRKSSVLRSAVATGGIGGLSVKYRHPTVKPIGVMRSLVESSPPGLILDPFMGSGSTLRAAKDFGRRAIGIEVEERYCQIAAKRCEQEALAFDVVQTEIEAA